MRQLIRRIKRYVYLHNPMFTVPYQERIDRQKFFYNAFRALSYNRISGDYVEFGCWTGVTFDLAYHESRRVGYQMKLWAFDSFQGLPATENPHDDHPKWVQGAMAMSLDDFHARCKSNGIPRDAYNVVPGFYDKTLRTQNAPNDICLAYIDCDLYSSTMSVLEFLKPRLKHGMIIAFDDYFCWSASQIAGERRAALEFFRLDRKWKLVPYMQFSWGGNSFVAERRRQFS